MRPGLTTVVLTTALLLLVTLPLCAQRDLQITPDQRRIALVIGADDYQHVRPLENAVNDANDLAAALTRLGFSVDKLLNPDQRGLEIAIDNFVGRLHPGDVALFHFSGHGIQVDGENYLVPVDFDAKREVDAKYDSYSASRVQEHLEDSGSRLNIIILDACRNSAFGSARSTSGGLAEMSAGAGTYIAFSTARGETADDNPGGRNGLFTSKLLETLEQPGLDLNTVFDRVRASVYETSGQRQLPWSNSSIIGEFQFRPAAPVPAPPAAAPKAQMELAFWNAIKDSGNPAEFEAYLAQYPSGDFAPLARVRLDSLRPATPSPTPEAAVARPASATPPPSSQTEVAVAPPGRTAPTPSPPTQVAVARPAPSPTPPPIIESNQPPQPGTTQVNPKDGLQYVWIPPGAFQMGCSVGDNGCLADEKPRHPVRISKGFWMGQTEVTVAAYQRFAGSAGKTASPKPPGFNKDWQYKDHPIVSVSWDEAKAYCGWLGARLPTEAEWEYAARAGSDEKLYGELDTIAWHAENSGHETRPVAGKQANAWGLHDMLGNVWEWVGDSYQDSFYRESPGDDPVGPSPASSGVLRGGSWRLPIPWAMRVSLRHRSRFTSRNNSYGFRCVGE